MRKRNINLEKKTERVNRERDPIPWRYCLLTLVCGLLLVVGFFWAARQHFSAMDFGIKNAKLRQQKESLEAEARRLYLTKEISLAPEEIKKAAKKLGLLEFTAQSIEIITSKVEQKNETPKQAAVPKSKVEKTTNLKAETSGLAEKNKVGENKPQTLPTLNPATTTRTRIAKNN